LGAVEAIRLARGLLASCPWEEDETDKEEEEGSEQQHHDTSNEERNGHAPQHKLCLGKLKALSKVGEQLNEYEKLVVRNLTDELVDTFLSWGSTPTSGDDTGGHVDYRSPPRVALSFDKRSKIRGVVQSLRLCGQLSGAGIAYQRRLCELISVTVKAIVTECVADAKSTAGNGVVEQSAPPKGTMAGVASMSLEQFIDCINMLFEQVLGLLWGAVAVNKFCIEEGLVFDDKSNVSDANASDSTSGNDHSESPQHTPSATAAALAAAVDLAEKSVSELLRLRREAHSLVSFDGMRQLWDTSLTFTLQLERFSGRKAYGLRSTLLAQAKSFVERKHEANMSTLAAAMDGERWVQCNVSHQCLSTFRCL
jgi:vacuolar protein sorting-associated protein 54